MCEAWNIIVKIFKNYSKSLLRCRRYVITLKVCTFPCGWACCFTFTFTCSLPVLSAISLRNRRCTYINCLNYLSTSSVVTLLQSLIRMLYCPVVAPLFWSSLRFLPTGPVVSMLFAALDHWCANWSCCKLWGLLCSSDRVVFVILCCAVTIWLLNCGITFKLSVYYIDVCWSGLVLR